MEFNLPTLTSEVVNEKTIHTYTPAYHDGRMIGRYPIHLVDEKNSLIVKFTNRNTLLSLRMSVSVWKYRTGKNLSTNLIANDAAIVQISADKLRYGQMKYPQLKEMEIGQTILLGLESNGTYPTRAHEAVMRYQRQSGKKFTVEGTFKGLSVYRNH